AEEARLREEATGAKARCPGIELAEDGLRLRRVGKLEAQAVQKYARSNQAVSWPNETFDLNGHGSLPLSVVRRLTPAWVFCAKQVLVSNPHSRVIATRQLPEDRFGQN